jgi:hypothetical protein
MARPAGGEEGGEEGGKVEEDKEKGRAMVVDHSMPLLSHAGVARRGPCAMPLPTVSP